MYLQSNNKTTIWKRRKGRGWHDPVGREMGLAARVGGTPFGGGEVRERGVGGDERSG